MPVYEIGAQGSTPPNPGPVNHRHSDWEVPSFIGGRQLAQVLAGNYQPGNLEVRLSAAPDGEEGYSLVTPPAYLESDPTQGLFTLAVDLPTGWLIQVRYVYT
jgi:hypothetical protein